VFLLAPLWVLWLILRGTLINTAGGGRVTAMVKAITTEARLTSLLNNGGSFGGDVYVNGTSHHGAINTSGNITMNNKNLLNLAEINTGHQTCGFHGDVYMNGYDIHMQGGSVLTDA
jgi:hypothetical protein